MKLLCVHPGASWSVADVWTGLMRALREHGCELVNYNLDGRIASAGGWLNYQWRRGGKAKARPNEADIQYLASFELPFRTLRHSVDAVLVVSGMYVHPDALLMCRRVGIKTGLLLTESPYDDRPQARVAPVVNVCWTNERTSVARLRQANPNTHYLPHAYDPRRHYSGARTDEPDVSAHDVVFVGTGFQERVDMLAGVDWTGIDLGLYGSWGLIPSRHRLRRYVRSGVIDNGQTAALYRRAKIGLNLYRTSIGYGKEVAHIESAESLNPRALELAACGLFHLSEHRAEVPEVFGTSVPTFDTSAQLEALIRRYLADAGERERLAAELPGRVRGRTFHAMAEQIVEQLERATWPYATVKPHPYGQFHVSPQGSLRDSESVLPFHEGACVRIG